VGLTVGETIFSLNSHATEIERKYLENLGRGLKIKLKSIL
jgi:hypothetical protein